MVGASIKNKRGAQARNRPCSPSSATGKGLLRWALWRMLRVREALGAYVANLIVVRLRWGLGVREGSRFIVLRFRISHRHLEHMLETMTL